jgi:hypothetical protein
MSTSKPKYRPVLTAAQITKILALAKLEQPISAESFSLISTLSPFAAKIANNGIQAAYSLAPIKPSTLESLGGPSDHPDFDITNVTGSINTGGLGLGRSKELYWEQCHDKYGSDPVACTLEEIQGAKEHMYLNDLMSPEEVVEFEQETKSNG